jgi:hypothetical protein
MILIDRLLSVPGRAGYELVSTRLVKPVRFRLRPPSQTGTAPAFALSHNRPTGRLRRHAGNKEAALCDWNGEGAPRRRLKVAAMEDARFDALAHRIALLSSRRHLMKAVAGGLARRLLPRLPSAPLRSLTDVAGCPVGGAVGSAMASVPTL